MNISMDDLQVVEATNITEEEALRRGDISSSPCPFCLGEMTIGDEEFLGACANCWAEKVK